MVVSHCDGAEAAAVVVVTVHGIVSIARLGYDDNSPVCSRESEQVDFVREGSCDCWPRPTDRPAKERATGPATLSPIERVQAGPLRSLGTPSTIVQKATSFVRQNPRHGRPGRCLVRAGLVAILAMRCLYLPPASISPFQAPDPECCPSPSPIPVPSLPHFPWPATHLFSSASLAQPIHGPGAQLSLPLRIPSSLKPQSPERRETRPTLRS